MSWRDTIDTIVAPGPNAPWWIDIVPPCGCLAIVVVLVALVYLVRLMVS